MMDSPSPEVQEVQVIAKEPSKLTAACDACRERKRKCDGKSPCHFCTSRRIPCQYSQRKKRGPPVRKKIEGESSNNNNINNSSKSTSLVSIGKTNTSRLNVASALNAIRAVRNSLGVADREYSLSNQTEMYKYINFYIRYMNVIAPICNPEKLTSPDTNECQVQSYSVVAIASRMCGDIGRSHMCIGSARQLAGSIYDSPQRDAAVAMLLMASYFQMDLDFPMTAHYIHMSWSLIKLLPLDINDLLYLYIYTTYLLIDKYTTNKQKEESIRTIVNQLIVAPDANPKSQFFARFLSVAVLLFKSFDSNIFWPIEELEKHYQKIYNSVVTEEDRVELVTLINELQSEIDQLDDVTSVLVQGMRIFTGVVLAVTEWKSGHDLEALSHSLNVTESLHMLNENNCLGFAADYTFICLLAQIIQYFIERNYLHQAMQLSRFVRKMCKIMGPTYDFVIQFMDQHNFIAHLIPDPVIPIDPTTNIPSLIFSTPSPPNEFSYSTPSPGSVTSPYNSSNEQPIVIDPECGTPYNPENNPELNLDNLEIPFTISKTMLSDLESVLPSNLPLIDLDSDPLEKVVFP